MRDKRAWAPVDIGYLDNPKMSKVLDASSTAPLMHLASILYCAQHLTDGHISPGIAKRKVGGETRDVKVLVDVGLWHEPGHDCEDCPQPEEGEVYVHNFLEHNRTADDVKGLSETRSKVARDGWKKRKKQATSTASSSATSTQDAEQGEAVSNAERDREKEREKEEEVTPDSDESTATPREDVQEVIDHMVSALKANDVRRYKVGKPWHDAARLMIDKDGYTVEQIKWVMDWATSNHFWKANIQSVPKLREKFDQLKIQALAEANGDSRKSGSEQRLARGLALVQAAEGREFQPSEFPAEIPTDYDTDPFALEA
jgi:hypothetical protein